MMKFLKRYNELWLGPLGVLLWGLSPQLIHWIDPTAATYDSAVWQKLIFGHVVFCVCSFSAKVIMSFTNPGLFKYLVDDFDRDFVTLTEDKRWEKLKLSFAVFAFYLLGLLLAMQVL